MGDASFRDETLKHNQQPHNNNKHSMNRNQKKQIKSLKKRLRKRRRRNTLRPRQRNQIRLASPSVQRTINPLRQIILSHKEFVCDLSVGSADTDIWEKREINPGLAVSFPWLSSIAGNFESYQFMELNFHFVPSKPATVGGTIALIPDYDSADANLLNPSRGRLLAHEDSVTTQIYSPVRCVCTKSNLKKTKEYYTRQSTLNSNLDIKTYDTLQLIIVSNVTETGVTGSLFVEYKIKLMTPQLNVSDSPQDDFLSNTDIGANNEPLKLSTGVLIESVGEGNFVPYTDYQMKTLKSGFFQALFTAKNAGDVISSMAGMGKSSYITSSNFDQYGVGTNESSSLELFNVTADAVNKLTNPYISWTGGVSASLMDTYHLIIDGIDENVYEAMIAAAAISKIPKELNLDELTDEAILKLLKLNKIEVPEKMVESIIKTLRTKKIKKKQKVLLDEQSSKIRKILSEINNKN